MARDSEWEIAKRAQKEIELKLEIEPASLPLLKEIPSIYELKNLPTHAKEVSVYYDTDEHTLRKRGLSLRVRRIGTQYIQTIKTIGNSGSFERDEWESEIEGGRPDLSLASGTPLKTLKDKLGRQLKPLFETRVHRTVYPLANDACAIEFTIDRGRIDTGASSAPICELELELKRGTEAELFDIPREVIHRVPAQLAFKSKSERGYELIEGKQDLPVKASPIDLDAGLSTRDAFGILGRACLQQVVDNEPAVASGHPERVHQMRVGVRRLRAAMSLFSDLLSDPQTTAIQGELKWLTRSLTQARELEVLMGRVVAPIKKMRDPLWKGVPSSAQELAERHKTARDRAHDAVTSAHFRAHSFWKWQHGLRPGIGPSPRTISFAAVATYQFAFSLLTNWSGAGARSGNRERRWRNSTRRTATSCGLVQKLRYAAEFFGSLFSGKRVSKRQKKFVAALAHFQDGLGELNDIVVDEHIIAATRSRHERSNVKRAFAAGLLTGREAAGIEPAMATATAGYAELVKVKPFWR